MCANIYIFVNVLLYKEVQVTGVDTKGRRLKVNRNCQLILDKERKTEDPGLSADPTLYSCD